MNRITWIGLVRLMDKLPNGPMDKDDKFALSLVATWLRDNEPTV